MVANSVTSVVDNITSVVNKNGTETEKAAVKAKTNYQDFLKLLTTQLQNQDPTAPTDTNQLTQQIATLSQVEQQINTNSNLEKLISMFSAGNISNMVSYIGKQIETPGDKGVLADGKAMFVYNLEKGASSVDLNIVDYSGKTVMSASGTKFAGRNEVLWDGTDGNGDKLPDGTYTLQVVAKDSSGSVLKATTSTVGVVSSVDSKNGSTTLMLGDVAVSVDKVNSIGQAI